MVDKGNGSESAAVENRRMENTVISEWGCGPGMVRKIELKNHDFVVENYSVRKEMGVGKAIKSDEFAVGGHRWAICLYPQGRNDDVHNEGYASVFVTQISQAAQFIQILYDIDLLDQSGNQQHCAASRFYSKEVALTKSRGRRLSAGCSRLITRASLDSPDSPYLIHDSLKISLRIGVFTYHASSPSSYIPFNKLSEMQWHDEFVFIKVADKTFCAAKSVLAASCPTLLSHDHHHQLQDLVIPDVDPYIFEVALIFIYTGALPNTDKAAVDDSDPHNLESFAAKLLAAANKFELKPLKKMCEVSISNKISRESVATKVRRMEKTVISEPGCGPGMVRKIELKNHDFVVENYSVRKEMGVGKAIKSDKFAVGGHQWAIYLYPQGQNDDIHNEGYASVFVTQMSHAAQPIHISYDIDLLDQSGNQDNWGVFLLYSKKVRLTSARGRMTGSSRFITRASLDSPDSPYLKHDSLKISLRIGVFTYHASSPSSYIPFNKLSEMQWHDEFVFVQVADKTFCAAKSVLAARCPTLLSHDHHHQLQDLVIPDVDPCIFQVAMKFIYAGALPNTDKAAVDDSDPHNLESFAAKLLAAANKFELKPLKKMCEVSISNKISRESVASLLHLADVCNATQLKSACLKFAAQNRLAIMESDGCELLKETCPLLFLELAGLGDSNLPARPIKGVLDTMVATIREFRVGGHWPWFSANKMKEF